MISPPIYLGQRTPLIDHRHLTQVEEELSRANALLKEFQTQQRHKEINESSTSLSKVNTVDRETVTPATPPSQSTEYRANDETEAAITQQSLFLQETFVLPRSRDEEPPETGYSTVRASPSNRDIMTSLERPPVSGNFEWDERSGQPGGRKFVDGMGSLTSDIDGSGYLGIATPLVYS